MYGWVSRITTPTKGDDSKYNMKVSQSIACIVNAKGIWTMIVLSKEEMKILTWWWHWKLKKKNNSKGEQQEGKEKTEEILRQIKGGITTLENNRRQEIRLKDIMSKNYQKGRNNGRPKGENKQKIQSNLTLKQHGELVHHNTRKPMTICSRQQTQQAQQVCALQLLFITFTVI